jgi:hypothetical protein
MLDDGLAARDLGGDEPVVSAEHGGRVRRAGLLDVLEHTGDAIGGQGAVDQAQLEELPGELDDLFFAGGHGTARVVTKKGSGTAAQTLASSRAAVSL